mmetsp:Transcript_65444/g.77469  ORF Transcript_65444/g.77469 Transcript_65444/m.77469 type:complete len:215 (+) Transcript_65444:503-1147(+)
MSKLINLITCRYRTLVLNLLHRHHQTRPRHGDPRHCTFIPLCQKPLLVKQIFHPGVEKTRGIAPILKTTLDLTNMLLNNHRNATKRITKIRARDCTHGRGGSLRCATCGGKVFYLFAHVGRTSVAAGSEGGRFFLMLFSSFLFACFCWCARGGNCGGWGRVEARGALNEFLEVFVRFGFAAGFFYGGDWCEVRVRVVIEGTNGAVIKGTVLLGI